MTSPQPQPQSQPQQPIYANELNNALDRQYARMVVYTDARIDALTTQMRVFREESIARDTELKEGMRALADAILKLGQQLGQRIGNLETRVTNIETRVTNIETRVTNIETTQKEMLQLIKDLHALTMEAMQDLHAEAMEAINDLRPKNIE